MRNQTAEENYPIIGNDLFNMFLAVAIVTTALLVVIVIGEWKVIMSLIRKVVDFLADLQLQEDQNQFQSKLMIDQINLFAAFKDRPPTAANRAQEMKENGPEESYLSSIKNLLTNKYNYEFRRQICINSILSMINNH